MAQPYDCITSLAKGREVRKNPCSANMLKQRPEVDNLIPELYKYIKLYKDTTFETLSQYTTQ